MQEKAKVVRTLEILAWTILIAGPIGGLIYLSMLIWQRIATPIAIAAEIGIIFMAIVYGLIMLVLAHIANTLDLYMTKKCYECKRFVRIDAETCKFCGYKF